jgi:hypothetical protein
MVMNQLDDHFAQYAESVKAMRSLRFPTLRHEQNPSASECSEYAKRLANLETSLLSKQDQIDLLWLRYRACVIVGDALQAIECLELASILTAKPAKQFAFAKLPQIGHADDSRHQAITMADSAEEEIWHLSLTQRAKDAIKILRKAANAKRRQK